MTLIYFSLYSYLGSNIPGVLLTWTDYNHLARRMFESEKLRKRGLGNSIDFLNNTNLKPDFKAVYYKLDMKLSYFY